MLVVSGANSEFVSNINCKYCARIIEIVAKNCAPVAIEYDQENGFCDNILYCGCKRKNWEPTRIMKLMVAEFTIGERKICSSSRCLLWARRRSMRFALHALRFPCNRELIANDKHCRKVARCAINRFYKTIQNPTRLDEKELRRAAEFCCQ